MTQAGLHAGVRVLEVGPVGIAAAYAGWMLARMGATVARCDSGTPAPQRADDSPIALALEVLADGKQRLPAGPRADAAGHLDDYDIVVCDDLGTLERLAGPVDALHARLPRLVIGAASVFGLDGPYAGFPGTGLDAQALSAVAWALGDAQRAPLSLPPGIVEHQSGAMLAAGCLLALSVRDATGAGQVVDVSLADVLASYVAGNCRFYIHHGLQWHRSGRRASGSGGAYPFVILPCKDGEVCICGRTRDEWNRLVQAMGSPEWAAQPRYQDLRGMGQRYPDEVDALMRPWLAQHTMAELADIALRHNLIVSPIRSMADVLGTPAFRDGGFLQPARAAGRDVLAPGLPFRVGDLRAEGAADRAGSLLAPVTQAPQASRFAEPRPPAAAGDDAPAPRTARPLAGLRVLDLGWVWSAPWVGTMLGELGAQVIKVEHALRPDNLRLSGRVIRDGQVVPGPSTEMSPMYHQINHGKLGVTLNTKDPRAVALVKRLAAISDVAVENMSPGSMERQKLGYDVLRAVNPRIVMLSMSAAGQFGALSTMRAYAPTMSSFVGMEALVGYRGEAPIGALNCALADPNASVHALAALLAALRHASATGQGSYIDLSQLEAMLGTLRPYLLQAQVTGRQPPPLGNAHPDMAPHGIYPAAGDDAWLSIVIRDDAQWKTLAALAPGAAWASDPRFATTAGRLAAIDALDAALADWTRSTPRDALVARLRDAGIAASPVLSVQQQWEDPHYAARGIQHRVNLPFFGEAGLFSAPWRFSDFKPEITRSGPTLGEHNQAVFGDLLGLPTDEIAALQAAGVIA